MSLQTESRSADSGERRLRRRFLEQLRAARNDPRQWIERHILIRTKDRLFVPLHLNAIQQAYYERRTARDLILKPRQVGFTTLNSALLLGDTLLRPNTYSAIVAQDAPSSERIFGTIRMMWGRLPDCWHTRFPTGLANKDELFWPGLNSRIYVGSAGSVNFGRGHTINNLLCTEVAHWPHPEDILTAVTQAVTPDGRIIIESTPNGFGNYFHDLWCEATAGQSLYRAHFFPWWWDPDYRVPGPDLGPLSDEEMALRHHHHLDDDQIRWRRQKQRELRDKFPQEYPEDDRTCFLTSGRCCFFVPALLDAQQQARQLSSRSVDRLPMKRRSAEGFKEVGTINVLPGRLTVWRDPERGKEYCIGADVAEGLEGGNFSAAVVLERQSGEQVAELHGHWRPDVFAQILAALGIWYRLADIAVEANNHGHTALQVLCYQLNYARLYYYVDGEAGSKPRLGWPTNAKTKPIMIDDLAAAVADAAIRLRSCHLIDECLSFVSKDDGVQAAQEGKHDDLVIAAAIAWQVRKRPRARFSYERPPGW